MTFLIRVVSEFSRRLGNHKPQRFDFLLNTRIMTGLVNSIFHRVQNVGSLTRNEHFSKWCVSILSGYICWKHASVKSKFSAFLLADTFLLDF